MILLSAVMIAGALVVGTGAATADASVAAKKAPACAGSTKKAAVKAIRKAYDFFLNGKKHPNTADKLPYVQGLSGKGLNPDLKAEFEDSAQKNAASAASTNVVVNSIKCSGKSKAVVDFTINFNGQLLKGLTPPGGALIDQGVWKVTAKTECDLLGAGDSSVLEKEPCKTLEGG